MLMLPTLLQFLPYPLRQLGLSPPNNSKGKRVAPVVDLDEEASDDSGGETCDGGDEALEEEPNKFVSTTTSRPKVLKAEVWLYYHCKFVDDVLVQVNCRYCGVSVPCHSRKNGTSSSRSHFRSCKRNPHNYKSKLTQSLIGFTPLAPNDALPSTYKGNWVFDEEATKLALVKKAIVDEDPLCVYEKPGWKVILAPVAFPPYFKLPGRTQLTRELLVLYENIKDELKTYFRTTNQRVSLTTDTWTATNQKINYMVVTAHYIDTDWKLQKRIIGFVQTQSKCGEDLGLLLQNVIREEWGIESVYCVTMDNASPNDALARSVKEATVRWGTTLVGGQHMHMRCAAHIINLIVTSGLKEHISSIQKIRSSIAYVRRSTIRVSNFKDAAFKEKITCQKHLQLDCPTRWNGVYIMLEIALKYKAAFKRYELIDKQLEADLVKDGDAVSSEGEWESVERLVVFLKHFYTLTKKVSGSWYMTSNLYLPEISNMYA